MSDTTDKRWPPQQDPTAPQWPAPPSATEQTLGERAFAAFLSHLGEREQGGENRGPVVRWAVERWPHGDEGDAWCAGAACSAYDDAGSEWIKGNGDLSCSALLRKAYNDRQRAYSIDPGEARQGDMVFVGRMDEAHKPFHMGLYDAQSSNVDQDVILAGNARDKVARQKYMRETDGTWSTHDGEKRLLVFVRIER